MQDRILHTFISSLQAHVLLLGPRQVGKSTLVRTLKPDLYINLALEENFIAYAKDPRRLGRELRALAAEKLIVVDEIQRVPQLLNTLQALIDENELRHRFILTGSSARKLRRGGANLLPGRVIHLHLDPLITQELGAAFDLDRALQVGMLPGIYLNQAEGALLLGSYVNTYLREEIQAEGVVQQLGSFSRLLDAVAVLSGQWLNYSKLASDVEIPKETVRRYLSVLEDTLVLHRLPGFRPRTVFHRRVSQKDKILLFDVGVRNALLGLHTAPPPMTERGGIFEQWLILQLIALSRAYRKEWVFSSYRTHDGAEVDLVIETPSKIVGIEIKAGATLHLRSHTGLRSLKELNNGYKKYEPIVAFTGERAQRLDDGTMVLPYLELLEMMKGEE